VPADQFQRKLVVIPEQPNPALVPHLGGAAGGTDDIGEQHGRQHALQLTRGAMFAMAGNELLDVTEHRLVLAGPERVVASVIFDIFDARNCGGELAAERDGHLKIGITMEYERRHLERRQDCCDIDLAVELQDRPQSAGAACEPLELCELRDSRGFTCFARGDPLYQFAGTPILHDFLETRLPRITRQPICGAAEAADQNEMGHAFGSAGTQAAGLWEFLRDAADSKQLHTAKAADR